MCGSKGKKNKFRFFRNYLLGFFFWCIVTKSVFFLFLFFYYYYCEAVSSRIGGNYSNNNNGACDPVVCILETNGDRMHSYTIVKAESSLAVLATMAVAVACTYILPAWPQ
jgi:hypothetical protein